MRQISHSKFTEILVEVRKHSAECQAVRRVAMLCEPDPERGGLAWRTARDSKCGSAEIQSMRQIKTEASVLPRNNGSTGHIYNSSIIEQDGL
jgi:hypothetical protein